MINAVSVINHSGETLRCVLENPDLSGFSITNITGIGPGKSEIGIKELVTLDGGYFQNSRISSRNIVLTYVFHDYWEEIEGGPLKYRSIEEARNEFYRFYVIKKPITLLFETDLHKYMISGYVESNEPEIFSSIEASQVSIMCPDPYFHLADDSLNENGNRTTTAFSQGGSFFFPFDNPVYKRTIEFGDRSDIRREQTSDITYAGDIDTGVIFHINVIGVFDGNYIDFEYYGSSRENELITKIRFSDIRFRANGGGLQIGDELIISTVSGNKYALIKRGAEVINVFYCVDVISDWIKLQKGSNWIKTIPVVISPSLPNVFITMEYPILCAGI